ncbi:hypothetical protein MLD38_027033 [Melastoma candidum]|uniref:Uncharacterized protein n=1 Tax=Melastoma candidum TaxID=119954 RepID=A0ACB9P1H1_9MYRT|nr:hypothetical protein MLD38_027033 [Melastoma candidum]
MNKEERGGGGGEYDGSESKSSRTPVGRRCEDCGNQAKKECGYMRCRTCCKSKGFHCHTHVRSTWIPSSSSRKRPLLPPHHLLVPPAPQNPRRRHPTPIPNPTSFPVNLPPEVSFHATFKCMRVSSLEAGRCDGVPKLQPDYAYQTRVSIGGHVFKGILYDQGPDHESTGERPSPCAMVSGGSSGSEAAGQMYIRSYPFTLASPIIHGSNIFPPPKS